MKRKRIVNYPTTARRYNASDKLKVQRLAEKGVTDGFIVEKTGYGIGFVQMTTTKYWDSKMKSKTN